MFQTPCLNRIKVRVRSSHEKAKEWKALFRRLMSDLSVNSFKRKVDLHCKTWSEG